MTLATDKRKKLYTPYLEILRDCRKHSGLTQSNLAAAAELSPKYVTLVEGGKRIPTVESMLAMMSEAGVLRSTAEQFLVELADNFDWIR